jgi:hypothetical protein
MAKKGADEQIEALIRMAEQEGNKFLVYLLRLAWLEVQQHPLPAVPPREASRPEVH